MKQVATCVMTVALVVLSGVTSTRATGVRDDGYQEKDRIDMNVELETGAAVTVNDISGPVTIETTDGSTAEIHVERSARTREDLEKKKIVVDHTSTSLTVQTEPHQGRHWDHAEVRQAVTLRLPRRVSLRLNDVAGRVAVGEIQGDVRISDVAGSLELGRVDGSPVVSDIAGSVTLAIGRLGEAGLHVSDIAGRLEVVIDGDTGADVEVSDVSGKIDVGAGNVTVLGKADPERFVGRIGGGGPKITISDIAGSVTVRN